MRKYVMGDNYFKNKKVVIIGASSENLDLTYIHKLFKQVLHLFLLGRNMDKLAEFSEDIQLYSIAQ